MAELIGDHAGSTGGYRLPPGSYAKLLKTECERQHAPASLLFPLEGGPDALAEWEDLKAAGAARTAEMFGELLAAAKPIVVSPTYHRGAPEWLSRPPIYGGASMIRVYSDDVCEPAEFYGDRLPNGVYERIFVEPQYRPRV